MKTGPKPIPPFERMWQRTAAAENNCIVFTGYCTPSGYGQVNDPQRGRMIVAHRLSWEHFNGPIPDGIFVLHHCDNPPCVNPFHLFLGNQADNIADMLEKGRQNNQKKTHCKRGHSFLEFGYIDSKGKRQCRLCQREYSKSRYYKQRSNLSNGRSNAL